MKLPEIVEWLERNYDTRELMIISEMLEPGSGVFHTSWRCDHNIEVWHNREEIGNGIQASQPMFTFKQTEYCEGRDIYRWVGDQFVPLSLESINAPLPTNSEVREAALARSRMA